MLTKADALFQSFVIGSAITGQAEIRVAALQAAHTASYRREKIEQNSCEN